MFKFDVHGRYETPMLILCSPIRDEIAIMNQARDIKYTTTYDSLDELEFKIDVKFDNDDELDYFKTLRKRKLVHAIDVGWFVINSVQEDNDGHQITKTVRCVSEEKTLDQYNANIVDGTYKFYDALTPQDSLLGKFLSNTTWKIGHVDTELWNKYRTFEFENDTGLYSYMRGDIEKAYDCVFTFDTEKKLVNAYDRNNTKEYTDIMLTFENVMQKLEIDEEDDDLRTALTVTGDKDLSIRTVNPLGTSTIYCFDYFKTPEWMTQPLIDALDVWEKKCEEERKPYSALLTNLKEQNAKLVKLEGELTDLKAELNALEQIRTVRLKGNKELGDITTQINVKEGQVAAKQKEVDDHKVFMEGIRKDLAAINKKLSFDENFTKEQLEELQCYTNAATYENKNYTITKKMTYAEIQDQAEMLYEDGLKQLKKISVPNYKFSMDTLNFLFLEEYQEFIDQIKLGTTVNAEIRRDYWIKPVLVQIVVDYENPKQCKLVFADSFRLVDEYCVFDDYDKKYNAAAKTLSTAKNTWDRAANSGVIDYVQDMRKDGLNLALTRIINAKDQSLLIDGNGLLGRVQREDGRFDPEQVKLVNNLLVFTDDNWMTAKAALGKIKMPFSENEAYGLLADVIVGELVASNELVITNESNSFKVDAGGAELINAYFQMKTADERSQITLDPNSEDGKGICIQTDTGKGLEDRFYVDVDGKIVAKDITTKSGKIGGWTIKDDGLYSDWGDQIKSDGTGKIGLMTYNNNSATFNGNIYARNLRDKVTQNNMDSNSVGSGQLINGSVSPDKLDWQVKNLIADKATIGELNAQVANIKSLIADKATIRDLNVLENATIRRIQGVESLVADKATVRQLEVLESATISKINGLESLVSNKATIGQLNAVSAKIDNLNVVGKITTGSLSASKININGHTCRNINISTGGVINSSKSTFVTRVNVSKKNGQITNVTYNTGYALTASSLVNQSSVLVVGVYN